MVFFSRMYEALKPSRFQTKASQPDEKTSSGGFLGDRELAVSVGGL